MFLRAYWRGRVKCRAWKVIGWNDSEIFSRGPEQNRPADWKDYLLYLTVLMRIDRQSGNMRIDAQRKGDKVCVKEGNAWQA